MTAFTYAEVCAGVGGLSRGLESAGMAPVFHCELADFPRRVLAHHWPDTPLLSDLGAIAGGRKMKRWMQRLFRGQILLLAGGTPCQDLSVAGKRAGIFGLRSSLYFRFVRLWKLLDCPYILWENVAGALSSNKGADFALVLSAIVGGTVPVPRDGWSRAGVVSGPAGVAAWRLVDAQWFGVPQRRNRVFVLGARAGGCDPAEVLLEPSGVRGNPPTRGEAREGVTDRTGERVAFSLGSHAGAADGGVTNESHESGGPVGMGIAEEMANSLRAGRVGSVVDVFAFGANNSAAQGDSVSLSVTPALDISKVPAVLSFDWQKGNDVTNVRPSTMSVTEEQAGTLSTTRVPAVLVPVCATDHVTHSLTHEGHDASEDGTGRGTPIVSYFDKQALGIYGENGVASTVSARDYKDATDLVVAATLRHKTHPTSRAGEGEIILGTQRQQVDGAMVATAGIPRRLMPVECERLMGWDDGWTDIPDAKGKPASDAARYKACGNGVVSQCGEWIGERLIAAHTDMLAECAA